MRREHNYGREGIALLAASVLVAIPGMLIGFIGIVLLLASGERSLLIDLAWWFMAIGVLVVGLGLLRHVQAGAEGRRFRGSRPFIRRFSKQRYQAVR